MFFLTITPRISKRLQRESFGPMVEDLFLPEEGPLDRESDFAAVRSAIVHLMHHAHYEPQVELAKAIKNIGDLTGDLLDHPDAAMVFSRERRARIRKALDDLLRVGATQLNEKFSEQRLSRFVEHARRARENYLQQGYNPDEFLEHKVFMFAALIRDNYRAWEGTLNHEYLRTITRTC